jgi:hypothetical protein
MAEEVYWTMKNGKQINVDDMDKSHLRNTVRMLLRNTKTKLDVHNMDVSELRDTLKAIIRRFTQAQIRQASRRSFQVNGELAREDTDKNDLRVRGVDIEDYEQDLYPDNYTDSSGDLFYI